MTLKTLAMAAIASMAAAQELSQQYSEYVAYIDRLYGNDDGMLTNEEIIDSLHAKNTENDLATTLFYDMIAEDYEDESLVYKPHVWIGSVGLQKYSVTGNTLYDNELQTFLKNDLELQTHDLSEVTRVKESVDIKGDFIPDYAIAEFLQDWMNGDFVFNAPFIFTDDESGEVTETPDDESGEEVATPDDEAGEVTETPDDESSEGTGETNVWPHGGEIARAIETNADSKFAVDGKLVGLEELVNRLSTISGPAIKGILNRYSSDHDWSSDYDFVTRYVVGSFVGPYEDLDADSLKDLIAFVGVGPVDDEIIQQVVKDYSEADTHHFTYSEQMSLIEDWFTGELQFTQIEGKRDTLERLEQISKNLDDEIARLKSSFRFRF